MFINFLLDLDNNINLILNKTNDKDETDANISKKVKDLHVFFFWWKHLYTIQWCSYGSAVGVALAGIFMMEMKWLVTPQPSQCIMFWKDLKMIL